MKVPPFNFLCVCAMMSPEPQIAETGKRQALFQRIFWDDFFRLSFWPRLRCLFFICPGRVAVYYNDVDVLSYSLVIDHCGSIVNGN